MAVLQMQRISICAMRKNRKAILERLQKLGVMEIDIRLEDDSGFEKLDTSGYRAAFEKQASQADQALEVLDKYAPVKKSMLSAFEGKPLEDWKVYRDIEKSREEKTELVNKILELDKKIAELKAENLKLSVQKEALVPWLGLEVPLNYGGTKKTKLMIGMMPSGTTKEQILSVLAAQLPHIEAVDIEILSEDKDYVYLTILCMRAQAVEIEDTLRAAGFARPSGSYSEIPAKMQEEIANKMQEHSEEAAVLEEVIKGYADRRNEVQLISDYYRTRADKYFVLGKLPQTKYTFAISGFVAAENAEAIKKEMQEEFQADVEIEEIKEEEEPPVILRNGWFAETVEGVLASFGLPHKGEIDPTAITSFFYIVLFGLMLSDAAYGLLVTIACGFLLKKYPRMGESLRKSIKLFCYCGVSTLIWGVLFGGYFGDVITVVSRTFFHHEIIVPPLWFAPLDDPMKMLMYSLLFGVIHLYTGLAMKGYICIKEKRWLDFVCDVMLWVSFLTGLILMLLPTELFASIAQISIVFPPIMHMLAKVLAIGGALGILFMSGRANKNMGVRIALGAYDLYGITGWLSDVLSYSRLLALGLATGVIASVVNQMGSMAGDGIFGLIVFVVVFVIGHTFNLAINLLGAYVHTCRLQYVEFFGKFYEGGGKAFEPFRQNTKYVDFKEETNL